MPTTNSPKGSAIPVRFSRQQRQQIDELVAAGFGNQTDVIRTAIDRMYVQEIREMKYINESDLSVSAQNKAQNQPDGNVVFAEPAGRGWKIFSIEPNLVDLAKAQGAISDDARKVRFGR